MVAHFPSVDEEPLAEIDADLSALRAAGTSFDDQREVYESRVVAGQGAFRLYFRPYVTADGIVSVAALSANLIDRFHQLTGLPAPGGTDPSEPAFVAVIEQAEALFATRTTAEWLTLLRQGGLPCSRYNLPHEAVKETQAEANGYVVDLEHPAFGSYRTSGMPVQLDKTPTSIPGPSPMLDQHTDEVLSELGLGAEIETLRRAGVVGSPRSTHTTDTTDPSI